METVSILMATYNGERFIKEQIDSLIGQTFTNWELYIRDDGSNDGTLTIINSYISQDSRIKLISYPSVQKGACANFSALYSWIKANKNPQYLMFCDQDDIWHSNKIELTLNTLKALEAKNLSLPCLIYGQMEFMDAHGQTVPGQIKMVKKPEFRYLLSYNFMYGCTMMLNKALLDTLSFIPATAENHDYWIALVSTVGKVGFIGEPLLRYRKHDSNVSGNVQNNSGIKQRLVRHTITAGKLINDIKVRLAMFVEFYKAYGEKIGEQNRVMLKDYLLSFRSSRLAVAAVMLKYRILRYSVLQTVSSFYLLLFFFGQLEPKKIIPAKI